MIAVWSVALMIGHRTPPTQKHVPGIARRGVDADWVELVGNIISGRDLHDSATRLAAAYIASGMDEHGTTRAIEALFLTSDTPQDERWKARFNDIERAVRTARQKFGQDAAIVEQPLSTNLWPWQFYGRQEIKTVRSYLIDKLLPETGVGLLSGQWGTYKTFTAVDLAAAVVTGTPFAGFPVARQGARSAPARVQHGRGLQVQLQAPYGPPRRPAAGG